MRKNYGWIIGKMTLTWKETTNKVGPKNEDMYHNFQEGMTFHHSLSSLLGSFDTCLHLVVVVPHSSPLTTIPFFASLKKML
jgi:hypothetical protein